MTSMRRRRAERVIATDDHRRVVARMPFVCDVSVWISEEGTMARTSIVLHPDGKWSVK